MNEIDDIMTEDMKNIENAKEEETLVVKLSDDLIAVIRELVQLSILTGTNVVDHFRAITCEIDMDTQKLIPTEEYVEAYNLMVQQLVEKAEAARDTLEKSAGISLEDLEAGSFGGQILPGDGSDDGLN